MTRPIGAILHAWRRTTRTLISGITYISRVDLSVTCEALFGVYPLQRTSVTIADVDPSDVIRVGQVISGTTTK